MSNKTQLQTNNTDLDALIARVNAAKDTASSLPDAGSGGGSGGGSVETCTLIIDGNAVYKVTRFVYQQTLGEFVQLDFDPMTSAAGTYTVVCGSLCVIELQTYNVTLSFENAEVSLGSDYVAPVVTANAGEIARITIN